MTLRPRSAAWSLLALVLTGSLLYGLVSAALHASAGQPLVYIPPAGNDVTRPLVLMLSGDGNWGKFSGLLGARAAAAGSPVIGLKSRSYFVQRRTPAEVARMLEPVVRRGLRDNNRNALVIIAYSRGADVAPFVVNRWPDDIRSRIAAIAFVALAEYANFEFHVEDLLHAVRRPSDLPVRPEVMKLPGVPMLCIDGKGEEHSFCRRPVPGMRVIQHEGGHIIYADTALVRRILSGVGIPS